MGTPEFAVPALEALIQTQAVVGVVTQPDRPAGRGRQLRPSPVKVAALAHDIPVYQPRSLRRPPSAEPLHTWQPDAIVVAAYGQILRPHVLDLPPHGCINVHASLLPRWRGASPIQHAILAGDATTGVCLMRMDVGMDTGPVYACASIRIAADETAQSLHDRLAPLGGALLTRYLDDILAGEIAATPQDNALATYAPLIKKEDGALDWTAPAVELERRIRAMTPWPGAFTTFEGQSLRVIEATVDRLPVAADHPPGTVVQSDGAIRVATGDGHLVPATIQLAGRRATPVDAFVNGRPTFIGSRLGVTPDAA